ncbi:MAG: dihydroxyacetone kinase subunit L, partial [Christensenellaceae bacterium]|nr:dihydroxyacetone kinase subunit L [Christensenellaceae bacterium]
MNRDSIRRAVDSVCGMMEENKDYLISLDQQNGDGDLGLSMEGGFCAVRDFLAATDEQDMGKLLMKCGAAFNEAAPSSLGTILSFGFMGMAKALKGQAEAPFEAFARSFMAGVEKIMERAHSKPGEKTVLDALYPAAEAYLARADDPAAARAAAARAAEAGSELTRGMRAVHGRAAYYGDKSIGVLD